MDDQPVETVEYVPEKYFKHLSETEGLYEIRVEFGSNIYRIFFFLMQEIDYSNQRIPKKTNQTPKSEIQKSTLKLKNNTSNEK